MLGKVVPQVVKMSLPPLSLAVLGNLAIHGIGAQFLSVIIGPALALTFRLATHHLLRTINRRQKRTMAVSPRQPGFSLAYSGMAHWL
jgi:hypothetical protein